MTTVTQKLSAREFLELPEVRAGAWLELAKGEVIMSPRPNRDHSYACVQLLRMLANHVAAHQSGIVYLEVDTVFDEDEVRAPDILYYSSARIPSNRDNPNSVIPDLCIEILSPFNARQDRVEKFELYQSKGVAHYWLIDPQEKLVEAYSLERGRYAATGRGGGNQKVRIPPFPELEIDLAELWHPPGS